ncbi:MAG: cell wall-binding repeat-containing protein [Erysipelotrichaceae bacterium]|nr:cell wall-binding repeat-containing protein [Erysipelotrichaceae bacterium]
MKKLLSIALSLLLALSLFAFSPLSENVHAEGVITNFRFLDEHTITWDPYPGATAYVITFGPNNDDNAFSNENSMDIYQFLSEMGVPAGDYTLKVLALKEEGGELAVDAESDNTLIYHHVTKGKLPALKNPRWEQNEFNKYIAMWDKPAGYEYLPNYEADLYRNGEFVDTLWSWGQPGLEMDAYVTGDGNDYSFKVRFIVTGYEMSDDSAMSPSVKGIAQKFMRISGAGRYETSLNIADQLLEKVQARGQTKFRSAVISTGKNYPDALSGSFLANRYSAPMLMIGEKNAADLVSYIKENVYEGSTVYVLGGTGAVPEEWLGDLSSSYNVKRLSGKGRYDTNLAILKEANVTTGAFLVCTGKNYADSLSCSALSFPMLLVGDTLNDAQREFLNSLEGEHNYFYIIGGSKAVSAEIEAELANHGGVQRISGKDRYETSAKIADFFISPFSNAVIATGKNFPDGLSGGPLASILGAPLLLVDTRKTAAAEEVTATFGVIEGYALGGEAALTVDTYNKIFRILGPNTDGNNQ